MRDVPLVKISGDFVLCRSVLREDVDFVGQIAAAESFQYTFVRGGTADGIGEFLTGKNVDVGVFFLRLNHVGRERIGKQSVGKRDGIQHARFRKFCRLVAFAPHNACNAQGNCICRFACGVDVRP